MAAALGSQCIDQGSDGKRVVKTAAIPAWVLWLPGDEEATGPVRSVPAEGTASVPAQALTAPALQHRCHCKAGGGSDHVGNKHHHLQECPEVDAGV